MYCTYKLKISNSNSLLFLFKNDYAVLTLCLLADIQGDTDTAKRISDVINSVLNNNLSEAYFDGNLCSLFIKKEETHILNRYANDTSDTNCHIKTVALKKIIFLYVKENQKFLYIKQNLTWQSFDPEYVLYTFLSSVYHKEVDFDQSFTFYIHSESAKALRRVKKQIRHFLASNIPDAEKCAYIKHCADGIHFDAEFIDPLAWLLQRLDLFPKTNNWIEQNLWPIIDWITDECSAIKKFIRNQR